MTAQLRSEGDALDPNQMPDARFQTIITRALRESEGIDVEHEDYKRHLNGWIAAIQKQLADASKQEVADKKAAADAKDAEKAAADAPRRPLGIDSDRRGEPDAPTQKPAPTPTPHR